MKKYIGDFNIRPLDCKNEYHYRALMFLHYLSLSWTKEEDVKRYAQSYLFWLGKS